MIFMVFLIFAHFLHFLKIEKNPKFVKNRHFSWFLRFFHIFSVFWKLKKTRFSSKSAKNTVFEGYPKNGQKTLFFWGGKILYVVWGRRGSDFVEQEAVASHSTKKGVSRKKRLWSCGTLGCLKPRTKSVKKRTFFWKSWFCVKNTLSWGLLLSYSDDTRFLSKNTFFPSLSSTTLQPNVPQTLLINLVTFLGVSNFVPHPQIWNSHTFLWNVRLKPLSRGKEKWRKSANFWVPKFLQFFLKICIFPKNLQNAENQHFLGFSQFRWIFADF